MGGTRTRVSKGSTTLPLPWKEVAGWQDLQEDAKLGSRMYLSKYVWK